MNLTKEDCVNACISVLKEKIEGINSIMNETQSSANTDTKSSAGDKHETSRAMAHLENERLGGQLAVLKDQLELIYTIKPQSINTKITLGSVVVCDDFSFFISTGLGKTKLPDGSLFFAIAKDSPIGKSLLVKNIGDTILVGNKTQNIISIL